jgi:hypothetical protein
MDRRSLKRQKLLALFFLGFVLLNGPVLTLFNDHAIAGIPLLFVYIFGVWFLLIIAMALITESYKDTSTTDE